MTDKSDTGSKPRERRDKHAFVALVLTGVVAGMAEYVDAGATELRVGVPPQVADETKAALAEWLKRRLLT